MPYPVLTQTLLNEVMSRLPAMSQAQQDSLEHFKDDAHSLIGSSQNAFAAALRKLGNRNSISAGIKMTS